MIALRVLHNGKEVCVAGIGDQGVLSAVVTWARIPLDSPPVAPEDLSLMISGLHTPTEEDRWWDAPDVTVGDTVTIEIVETEDITPHDRVGISEDEDDEPD